MFDDLFELGPSTFQSFIYLLRECFLSINECGLHFLVLMHLVLENVLVKVLEENSKEEVQKDLLAYDDQAEHKDG